jgi:hypothetical protein
MDDDRWYDINVIAGAFKSFMRELPDQALGPVVLNELRNLTGMSRCFLRATLKSLNRGLYSAQIPDEEDRVPRYREVMMKLRPHNYHFLRRVYIHFARYLLPVPCYNLAQLLI